MSSIKQNLPPAGWRTMTTAPRDGRPVELMDPEWGSFVMRWDADGDNALVSRQLGIWVALDGSMTWCEDHGCGPNYWRPVKGLDGISGVTLH